MAYPQLGDVLLAYSDTFIAKGIDAVEYLGMLERDETKPLHEPIMTTP